MLIRSAVLALSAIVAIGSAVLTSTSASALQVANHGATNIASATSGAGSGKTGLRP